MAKKKYSPTTMKQQKELAKWKKEQEKEMRKWEKEAGIRSSKDKILLGRAVGRIEYKGKEYHIIEKTDEKPPKHARKKVGW